MHMYLYKNIRTLLFILFFVTSSALVAQTQETHHYINVWGAGGYATIFNDVPYTKASGGPGALVGFGYELSHKRFLFSFGAEFDYKYVSMSRNDFRLSVDAIDTEGDPLLFHYNFTGFTDRYSLGYINVPIFFGGKFNKVYFLVGAKVGINLFGSSSVQSHIKTTGTYPWALEEFQNMPDHFFTDYDVKNEYPIRFGLSVAPSAEVGYLIPKSKSKSLFSQRVALFVDYGVLNIHQKVSNGNVVGIPTNDNILNVKLNPLMLSDQALNSSFNPFMIGIKYTASFEIPVPKTCKCLQTKPSNYFKGSKGGKGTQSKKSSKK